MHELTSQCFVILILLRAQQKRLAKIQAGNKKILVTVKVWELQECLEQDKAYLIIGWRVGFDNQCFEKIKNFPPYYLIVIYLARILTLMRAFQGIVCNYDTPDRGSEEPSLKGEKLILGFYVQQLKSSQGIYWYACFLKDWLITT